jgi:twitching motility protein PilT
MAWLDGLLKTTMEKGASDLHITSKKKPMIRVDGSMADIASEKIISPDEMYKHLQEIAPKVNWTEYEERNDTDFAYKLEGIGRFRVNFFRDLSGPAAVFRFIPSKIPTFEQLNLPPSLAELCKLRKGLVLVTGPTGSGKSTTLAAMVNHINQTRDEHIITIEDPVEFVYENNKCAINQREVGTHTKSFRSALRAALREDPDIVLVGEMRDLETVEIAIETAETGHLVFGTLHTTTAASTVNRIIDQFPADRQSQIRTMLAASLKGVVAQALCKKIGGGRVAALEILIANQAVAANIRDGKIHSINNVIQVGRSQGMHTLNDHLVELVHQGLVSQEEAISRAVDREDIKMKLPQ